MSAQREPATQARIVIAHSAELVRRGIRDVLGQSGQFAIAGETGYPAEAAQACLELTPDLLFLGLEQARGDGAQDAQGLAALRRVRQLDPQVRVIALVEDDSVEHLTAAIRAGARGILLRDASADTVREASRDVLASYAALDPRLTARLFERLAAGAEVLTSSAFGAELNAGALRLLSPREREVLRALAHGQRNKEIAAQLGVSVGTVKTHLRHIFRKLRVGDRTAAVLTALQVRLPEAA